jgi:hypothetical protein
MPLYKLQFELRSAATFGRGDGVAGLVDREVEHDTDGLPFLRGRTLRGLLAEECANLLYAVGLQQSAHTWGETAYALFGQPGSTTADTGMLRVGDARLPESLRDAVRQAIERKELKSEGVLESLTAVRRQTSMNVFGAPEKGSLRAMRVILPGTIFEAALSFNGDPDEKMMGLLAACMLALRRAGTGRNRGRGRLSARLLDEGGNDVTEGYFRIFAGEVTQ